MAGDLSTLELLMLFLVTMKGLDLAAPAVRGAWRRAAPRHRWKRLTRWLRSLRG